jgi:hypothetical protein
MLDPAAGVLVAPADPGLPQPQISEDGEHDHDYADDVEDVAHVFLLRLTC